MISHYDSDYIVNCETHEDLHKVSQIPIQIT